MQVCDCGGVSKAKIQIAQVSLRDFVFLMDFIKNNEIVLDYCSEWV